MITAHLRTPKRHQRTSSTKSRKAPGGPKRHQEGPKGIAREKKKANRKENEEAEEQRKELPRRKRRPKMATVGRGGNMQENSNGKHENHTNRGAGKAGAWGRARGEDTNKRTRRRTTKIMIIVWEDVKKEGDEEKVAERDEE